MELRSTERRAEDRGTPGRRASDIAPLSPQQGVLVYSGRNYAVGLLWLTVQDDTAKELLKQRISKSKADFFCLRTHVSQQQGFGQLAKGHRRGMQAAAAMIADQLVGEWHGVFEAENGWWYVQVRSDTITPNGDRFFTSEEEAYQTFQDEAAKNIWPHSYAPEKWHLADANTRELKLAGVLDSLSDVTLQPTNLTASFGSAMVRNIVFGGLSAVLAIMIAVAATSLVNEPVEVPQSPMPARTVSAKVLADKAAAATANQSVSPQQLLKQCSDAADQLYLSLTGWQPQTFTCAVGKASLSWTQKTGSLSDAKTLGMKLWPKTAAVTFNNRLMTVNITLGNLPKMERSELVTQEMALLYLEQNMQPLGSLQVKTVTPPPPPKPVSADGSTPPAPTTPPPPETSSMDIQFETGFGPDKVSPLLMAPGLEIAQVQWDIIGSKWQYKLKWTIQSLKPVAKPAARPGGPVPGVKAAPATGAAPAGGQAKPAETNAVDNGPGNPLVHRLVNQVNTLHPINPLTNATSNAPADAAMPDNTHPSVDPSASPASPAIPGVQK